MYSLVKENNTDVLEISSASDLLEFGGVVGKHALEISNFKHSFQFNGVIRIRDGITSTSDLFSGYHSLNCPVILPDGLVSCEGMFDCCFRFNFPVIIPESVEYCNTMFKNCLAFNQPVIIPSNVKYCTGMFCGCRSFDQPLIIPSSVIPQSGTLAMLTDCAKLKSTVIFESDLDVGAIKNCFRGYAKLRQLQILTPYGSYLELLDKSKEFIFD